MTAGARCTGVCCRQIAPLSHSLVDIGAHRNRAQDVEAAKIWTLLRSPDRANPFAHHACVALTEDGCALGRDDRPRMCTAFPYGFDKACGACGATSDAEARGVALARVTR